MIAQAKLLAADVGVNASCHGLDVARATYCGSDKTKLKLVKGGRKPSTLALTASERDEVIGLLYSSRFADKAPAAIHAILLRFHSRECQRRKISRCCVDDFSRHTH